MRLWWNEQDWIGFIPETRLDQTLTPDQAVERIFQEVTAGLVEIPCIKRNASGVANALCAAELALAGIASAIPADAWHPP